MEGGSSDSGDAGEVEDDEGLEEELFAEDGKKKAAVTEDDTDDGEEEAESEESEESEESGDEESAEESSDEATETEDDGSESESATSGEAVGTYTVQASDTLWSIAAKPEVYGSGWKYPLIIKANKDLLRNPNNLKVGTDLRIPRDYSKEEEEAAKEEAMADQYESAPTITDPAQAVVKEDNVEESVESMPTAAPTAEKNIQAAENQVSSPVKKMPRKKAKGSGGGMWMGIIALLLVAGGGAFMYMKKKREAEELDGDEEM